VKGARPKAKENKELADTEKVARSLKTMFTSIVRETINNRRRIPNGMAVFGGQSFRLRIHLFYLDYCAMLSFSFSLSINIFLIPMLL